MNKNSNRGLRRGNVQNSMQRDGDVLVKRLTLPIGQVSSTAGGIIAVTSYTAAYVQSQPATEWSSFASRYQQFRVRSVTLILEPRFPASGTPVVTVGSHGALVVADFIGASAPANAAQLLSDERAVVTSTSKPLKFTVDWARNPNAKLWNPTNAALPVANSYAIAISTTASSVLVASTAYYDAVIEWVVEFRGSQ